MQLSGGSEGQANAAAVAASWIAGTLTGTLASTIAIIAVACLGLMLMAGRLPRGRAAQLIIGCFIVFGAPVIAAGIMKNLALSGDSPPVGRMESAVAPVPPVVARAPATSQPYDPYAGAAVPPRR